MALDGAICVDLDLTEQLIHLGAAVHLAFYLFWDNSARMWFMPSQSYVDIMIMAKNAFTCVAKTKVDKLTGDFYLILLGTDRLETIFGIGLTRTAVGTDGNVDMLQLGNRVSGLTEVAVTLAEHPEWDYGTRRLALPVTAKDTGEVTSKADHIRPRDCCFGCFCEYPYLLVAWTPESRRTHPRDRTDSDV